MLHIRSMPLRQSRLKSTVSLFFATTLCLYAAARVSTPEITINIYDYAGIEADEMAHVEHSAEASLGQAGIHVQWRNCRVAGSRSAGHSDCGESADDATQFVVAVLPERMSRKIASSPKQSGMAVTSGAGGFPIHAYVFYDRVVDLATSEMTPASLLLGTTIAHEVGHLLLGDNSHFSVGIMRGQWRPEEIKQALMGVLTFTSRQAAEMRGDVGRRMKTRQ